MHKGIAASPGVGIGKAVILVQPSLVVTKQLIVDADLEIKRLTMALEQFCTEVLASSQLVREMTGNSEAEIIEAQAVLANDPQLIEEVHTIIHNDMVCAEYAFDAVCTKYILLLSSMEDELIRARSSDLLDIRNHMINILTGRKSTNLSDIPQNSVLVAEDIPPSQTATLDPNRISGIITQTGTPFSHIAIIARALQIPTVVAVPNIIRDVVQGEELVVDGGRGEVLLHPDKQQLSHYISRRNIQFSVKKALQSYKDRETRTLDGIKLELSANLTVPAELGRVLESGAQGIGLFRTEFLYMESDRIPSETEQFESYKTVAEAMKGKPVIIRTLDVGGDKSIPYLGLEKEENPFLGYRAIRYSLNRTDIFRLQLAAILRASTYGDVRIMFPMISHIGELRKAKALLEETKAALQAAGIPFNPDLQVGIMIETPAAALSAHQLARECDFFSIGTNDLVQYTLAVDRGNDMVSHLYTPMHPAVLQLIHHVAQSGSKEGIMVGVCGEAASDPQMIPLLLGAGVTELSVNAGSLLEVRCQLEGLDVSHWNILFQQALRLETAQEIADFVNNHL